MNISGFESYLRTALLKAPPGLEKFWEGMEYSLFGGGKRFRPQLCLMTAAALGKNEELVYPLASAIEMIHTYSLIHDDLPCLDNDDVRRGRPTHHRKYGEDMALLAGDGLLTLAFFTLAEAYSAQAGVGEVIKDVAAAAGVQGMVGGQVLDMLWPHLPQDKKTLDLIHGLKTGALIAVSVRSSALLCEANPKQLVDLGRFGEFLGLAFQVADDVQDFRAGEKEKNFATLMGEAEAIGYLKELSESALMALSAFGDDADSLRELVKFNQSRL